MDNGETLYSSRLASAFNSLPKVRLELVERAGELIVERNFHLREGHREDLLVANRFVVLFEFNIDEFA